jgi:hypothetical protein
MKGELASHDSRVPKKELVQRRAMAKKYQWGLVLSFKGE